MTSKRRSSLPFFVLLSFVFALTTGCPTTGGKKPKPPEEPEIGQYGAGGTGQTPPVVNTLTPGTDKK